MDFQIKMNVKPGDTHVSKATVKVFDAKGAETAKQVVLEGETAETRLTLTPGGRIEVTELERPLVYDPVQKAAVPADLTPEDPLTDPNRPKPGTPLPEAPTGKVSGGAFKPDNVVDTKPATGGAPHDNKSKK